MPTVPKYNPGQVQRSVLPSTRQADNATARAFGGAAAQDLDQIGKGITEAGLVLAEWQKKEKAKRDLNETREKVNEAREKVREYMSEVYSRKGKAAGTAYADTGTFLKQTRQEMTEGMDDEMKGRFLASYDSLMNGHLNRSLSHQGQQNEVYRQQSLDSANLQTVKDMVAQRNDPNAIEMGLAEVRANTRAKYLGDRKGVADEKEKEHLDTIVNQAVAHAHHEVLEGMKGDGVDAVDNYLKLNWNEINTLERENLKAGVDKRKAEIQTLGSAKKISLLPLDKQLAEIRKIEDPRKMKQVEAMVGTLNDMNKAVEKERRETQERDFWNAYIENPTMEGIPFDLHPDVKREAEKYFKARMKAKAEGLPDIKSDVRVKAKLYNDIVNGKPADVNIFQHASKLSQADQFYLSKLKSDQIASSVGGSNKKSMSIMTPSKYMTHRLKNAGIDAKNDPDNFVKAMAYVQTKSDAGEVKNMEDLQKVADLVTTQVVTEKATWRSAYLDDDHDYIFNIDPAERERVLSAKARERAELEKDNKEPDDRPDDVLGDWDESIEYTDPDGKVITGAYVHEENDLRTVYDRFGNGLYRQKKVIPKPTGVQERDGEVVDYENMIAYPGRR